MNNRYPLEPAVRLRLQATRVLGLAKPRPWEHAGSDYKKKSQDWTGPRLTGEKCKRCKDIYPLNDSRLRKGICGQCRAELVELENM